MKTDFSRLTKEQVALFTLGRCKDYSDRFCLIMTEMSKTQKTSKSANDITAQKEDDFDFLKSFIFQATKTEQIANQMLETIIAQLKANPCNWHKSATKLKISEWEKVLGATP